MCNKSIVALIAVATLFVSVSPVQAVLYPLVIFNNSTFAADPQLSFSVEALDGGTGKVDFIFRNTSTIDSTIGQVYFDGGLLTGIASITNGTGTNFVVGSTPADLPSGNTIGFAADFSAGAMLPPAQYGIDPGESITVAVNLLGSHTLSEITGQLDSGTMRIGAHIISVSCSEVSVSAVTPEPATIALLGLGSLILRKRSKR